MIWDFEWPKSFTDPEEDRDVQCEENLNFTAGSSYYSSFLDKWNRLITRMLMYYDFSLLVYW